MNTYFLIASFVWNFITNNIRCDQSLSLCKSCLKMYFVCSIYNDLILYFNQCTHVHVFVIIFDFSFLPYFSSKECIDKKNIKENVCMLAQHTN